MTSLPIIERWTWLVGSLGIAIVVSAVLWIIGERRARAGQPPRHPLLTSPWLVHSLRLLYAIGIPTAALLWRGALTLSGLGLQPLKDNLPDWLRDLGWVTLIGGITCVVVFSGERLVQKRGRTGTALTIRRAPGQALIEAAYHQVHWSFYREPFVLISGVGLGAWLGLLPVLAEAAVNPQRWIDLQHPTTGRNLLVRAAFAVTSALIFLQTQNLWLALAADAVLGVVLGQAEEYSPQAPAENSDLEEGGLPLEGSGTTSGSSASGAAQSGA